MKAVKKPQSTIEKKITVSNNLFETTKKILIVQVFK